MFGDVPVVADQNYDTPRLKCSPEERFEVKLDALQTTGAVMVRVLVEDGFGHRTVAGAEL